MLDADYSADFYLAQIVSHYQSDAIDRFMKETEHLGVKIPGIFGVFYYRSANAKTFDFLSNFLPVPAAGLQRDFAANVATRGNLRAQRTCIAAARCAKHLYQQPADGNRGTDLQPDRIAG